jgi:hypothetical protein
VHHRNLVSGRKQFSDTARATVHQRGIVEQRAADFDHQPQWTVSAA